MLPARLRARCPSARLIGPAEAQGFGVRFEKRGMDGSGKATLIAGKGAARGAVFRLDRADLAALDRAEGAGRGYDRHDRITILLGGQRHRAMTYVAPHPVAGLRPFDWYLALVLAGARCHGFDAAHLAGLRRTPWQPDPDPDRPGRREGLAALAAHGIGDLNRLLAGTTPPDRD